MSSPGFREYQTCKKKKRYPTEEQCRKSINSIMRLRRNKGANPHRKEPTGYYYCKYCEGWHITSKR